MHKIIRFFGVCCLIILVVYTTTRFFQREKIIYVAQTVEKSTPTPTAVTTQPPVTAPTQEPSQETIDFTDVNSLLLVANKSHPLPDGYEPSDLTDVTIAKNADWKIRKVALSSLEEMSQAAQADGVKLIVGSAYRSSAYQRTLYQSYVNQYGTQRADRISSRPNYSEHQTGLAIDFVNQEGSDNYKQSFENTPEGMWLAKNAHRFGWILRYPNGKEEITGYNYEPWHFRYVGVEVATKIYEVDPNYTFEEYFKVDGGQTYQP